MSHTKQELISRWSYAAYAAICMTFALVLALGAWATWNDMRVARKEVRDSEVDVLRSQAIRRVGHLETNLNEKYGEDLDWFTFRSDPWVEQYWRGVTPLTEHELYAAIVNPSGVVILHSKPELIDGQLSRRWYNRTVDDAGLDVVELRNDALSDGKRAFDIHIPIMVNGKEVAAYHEGLDADWLDAEMDRAGWQALGKWMLVIVAMVLALLMAIGSLLYIAARKTALARAIRLAQFEHVLQVEQLAAGLAHEIRNPLHALRLNLHVFGRAWRGKAQLEAEEVGTMLAESNCEIDRVERLMQELLGFAQPEEARNETFSAGGIAQATVNFLREEMRRKDIKVQTALPPQAVYVRMDPSRFRQALINLLGNAREAVDEGGTIQLSVAGRGGKVEIAVADDGKGVDDGEREHIFDPFFSTKDNGSGFGLALVRKFVEEAGGRVTCEDNHPHGALFRILLPQATPGLRRESPNGRD